MLDGLLGRGGFSSRCKSLIKPTRARIEALRRRVEAKQRFLKEDLVKLLANGLDVNAYGRTEEFIAGMNLLSCYSFIDQSCEYMLKHLSIMQKQGVCPEECRETVASLMFAAARFSDLPELRDLRDVFQERYGNCLECFVNQVFVEKLSSKPPVMEKRVKLLQDIAAESSIQWDSKGFKQRMDKPSTLAQDPAKKLGPLTVTDDKYKLHTGNNAFPKNDQCSKERLENAHDRQTLHNGGNLNIRREEVLDVPFVGREEKRGYKHEGLTSKAETTQNRENDGYFSKARQESASKKHGYEKNDTPLVMKSSGNAYHERRPEAFDDDKVNRGRKEKHRYKQEPLTRKAETFETGYNDDHLFNGRQESKKHGFENNGTPLVMKSRGTSYQDGRPEVYDDDRVNGRRKEKHGYKKDPLDSRAETIENGDDDRLFRGRKEVTAKKHESSGGTDNTPMMRTPRSSSRERRPEILGNNHVSSFLKGERRDLLYNGKSDGSLNGARFPVNGDGNDVLSVNDLVNQENAVKPTGRLQEEEAVKLKSSYNSAFPPPYVKSNIPPPYSKRSKHTSLDSADTIGAGVLSTDRIHKKQDNPYHGYGAHRSSDDPSPHNVPNLDRIKKQPDQGLGEDRHYQNDIPLPRPRSIRRKHSKSLSSHDDVGSSEDARIVKRISSSRRKERKGLQILFDDEHYHRDEEEKLMDRLLLHYSKKPSAYDVGKLRKKSRSNTSKSPHHRSKDEVNDESEMVAPPTRSISLPHEQSGKLEPKKVYARANSFQPDNQARHVHPKLPDYDDLAARFAALRGR